MRKYKGMPRVILTGKVTASAMGRKSPGFAFGTVIFIAAGTAIYEALAAKMANINLLLTSSVMNELNEAKRHPLNKGMIVANSVGKRPKEKNDWSFFPLVIPISKRKIARNPLKRSFVNGAIPSACLALAIKPMTRLPNINSTLPLVRECFRMELFLIVLVSFLLNTDIKTNPIMMAGDSIKAMIATMCPCRFSCCASRKETAVTNVTALTEP